MSNEPTILLTGGTGRLGVELRRLLPDVIGPTHAEMDITNSAAVEAVLDRVRPAICVHAAAYTDVAGAEADRAACWRTNVDGTRNMVRAAVARDIFLVHISTDCVFEGTDGMYAEDAPLGPPINYYALTKLVAESLVRLAPRHLVIRTSFRPRQWPYPVAFTDVFATQDYVDVLAPDIALAIRRCLSIPFDTLHIASGQRRSAFELARIRRPDVKPGSKAQAQVRLADDLSLDCSRWKALKERWLAEAGSETGPIPNRPDTGASGG